MLPEPIFRKAKARAAATQVAEEKITAVDSYADKPWMKFAGALADFHEENVRIAKMIEEEFERIEPEDGA
ncbi:MAG: hypothetical protein ABSG41_10540 [Bryobacteraceae bacterium]|jgi:hypothetical protein